MRSIRAVILLLPVWLVPSVVRPQPPETAPEREVVNGVATRRIVPGAPY